MHRSLYCAAALLLVCAVAAQAREVVEEHSAPLLQRALDRTNVHKPSSKNGWRLLEKNNNKACGECEPQLHSSSSWMVTSSKHNSSALLPAVSTQSHAAACALVNCTQ